MDTSFVQILSLFVKHQERHVQIGVLKMAIVHPVFVLVYPPTHLHLVQCLHVLLFPIITLLLRHVALPVLQVVMLIYFPQLVCYVVLGAGNAGTNLVFVQVVFLYLAKKCILLLWIVHVLRNAQAECLLMETTAKIVEEIVPIVL